MAGSCESEGLPTVVNDRLLGAIPAYPLVTSFMFGSVNCLSVRWDGPPVAPLLTVLSGTRPCAGTECECAGAHAANRFVHSCLVLQVNIDILILRTAYR